MMAVTLTYEGRRFGTATETFRKYRKTRGSPHASPRIVSPMEQAERRADELRAEGRKVLRIW